VQSTPYPYITVVSKGSENGNTAEETATQSSLDLIEGRQIIYNLLEFCKRENIKHVMIHLMNLDHQIQHIIY
jgi:hypothetical protein